jgi:LPS export ABC transporter protein LptC
MVLRQVSIVETRAGQTLWEVRADQVEVLDRDGITILSRVTKPIEVVFHSPQGQVTCQANRATLDTRTKDVRLEGSVVARSDQGTEVKTESLRWLAASRRLLTDQAVTISRGTWVSQGRGMEAETDLEQVRIFQNITSQVGRVTAAPGRSRHP